MALPRRVGRIQSIKGLNRTKQWRTGEFDLSLSHCLSWDISLLPLEWDFYQWCSWISGLQNQTGTTLPAFLVSDLQMEDHGTSQPPQLHEPVPCNKYVFR